MLTAHATAAPLIPNSGIRITFSAMLDTSAAVLSHRIHELLPPMNSAERTAPVAMFSSIAMDRICSAVAPAENPGPKIRISSVAYTASAMYIGNDSTDSHSVAVW